ncbi:hypothetical protein ACWD4O_42235 [Streptomyces sp. NPDC002623]
MIEELVEGGLPVVDDGAFIVGEWDIGRHLLQVAFRLRQLAFAGFLRGVEVAACAGHVVLALLEEGVGAPAVAEVVVLPGFAAGSGTGGDRVAVDEDSDGAYVPDEVASVVVGRPG